MIESVNIAALERLIVNNEKAPKFNLGRWVEPCGTYGCLVGNDLIAIGQCDVLVSMNIFDYVKKTYGLTGKYAGFLFCNSNYKRTPRGFIKNNIMVGRLAMGVPRDFTDRHAAINRVRKFVAYVRKKRALIYDEHGRVRESARRTEGDLMILRSAKAEAAAEFVIAT